MHRLFNRKTLDRHRQLFAIDQKPQHHQHLSKWSDLINSDRIYSQSESSLRNDFTSTIVQGVLGYQGPAAGPHYTLATESKMVKGRVDLALGYFGHPSQDSHHPSHPEQPVDNQSQPPQSHHPQSPPAGRPPSGETPREPSRIIAPFELKGPATHLDAIMPGRHKSPVQQAWDYAIQRPGVQWVIISNMIELRLYSFGGGIEAYETFELKSLTQPDNYSRFMLLLSVDQLLSGPTYALLKESREAEHHITQKLYQDYKGLREQLITTLQNQPASESRPPGSRQGSHPPESRPPEGRQAPHSPESRTPPGSHPPPVITPLEAIPLAQKILDRVLFIAFAEDTGLLLPNTLIDAFEARNRYIPKPIWDNFKSLFNAIDQGNDQLKIPPYNGGLFQADPVINQLALPDHICEGFRVLGGYDFASEISVTILGRIFEQSISDIEHLQAQAQAQMPIQTPSEASLPEANLSEASLPATSLPATDKPPAPGRRKQEGIVYTPDYIARFIVDQTLGAHLKEIFTTLLHQAAATLKADLSAIFISNLSDHQQDQQQPGPQNGPQPPAGGQPTTTPTQDHPPSSPPHHHADHHHADQPPNPSPGGADKDHPQPPPQLSARDQKALNKAESRLWQTYRERLTQLRIVDPACGSGVFLVMAFEHLRAELMRVNRRIAQLENRKGHMDDLINPDSDILSRNLFGVDINLESVEITRLSLWLKTARRGKKLDRLSESICIGHSLRADSFSWQAAFPEIMAKGGFDIVIGNPPYVRQERLAKDKPYFADHFTCYHGVADLFCYFYEQGLRLLKPGGRLGYISSNTFLKTSSAQPLRSYLQCEARIESLVHFGDLQIFKGVAVCTAILTCKKGPPPADHELYFWKPQSLPEGNFTTHWQAEAQPYPQSALGQQPPSASAAPAPPEAGPTTGASAQASPSPSAAPPVARRPATANPAKAELKGWELENPALRALRYKIKAGRPSLKEIYGELYRGVTTGFNTAFVIDHPTKERLCAQDPRSAELIKPLLEGKDLKRWCPEPRHLWLIFTQRGIDIEAYPALKAHLNQYRTALEPKPQNWQPQTPRDRWPGRKTGPYKWFEIQDTICYYPLFAQPKIIYPHFNRGPNFAFDPSGTFPNAKSYIIPTDDLALLALLNSGVLWFLLSSITSIVRGRFHELKTYLVETLPIPAWDEASQQSLAKCSQAATDAARERWALQSGLRARIADLCPPGRSPKLTTKLKQWHQLADFAAFRAEIKKAFKDDIPLTERSDWENWLTQDRARIAQLSATIRQTEAQINSIIYRLFNLTPAEITLLETTLAETSQAGASPHGAATAKALRKAGPTTGASAQAAPSLSAAPPVARRPATANPAKAELKGWELENPALRALRYKIKAGRPSLKEIYGELYRGVLTGFNTAFVIDHPTKERLCAQDPRSAELIKPLLEGKDLKRWCPEPRHLWLIFTQRGIDIEAYPALKAHLNQYRTALEPKPQNWQPQSPRDRWPGRKAGPYEWFEIQDPVRYHPLFAQPKIIYPEFCIKPQFSCDSSFYCNNKCYFIPTSDLWLAGYLNSFLGWFLITEKTVTLSNGTHQMHSQFIETIILPTPSDATRAELTHYVDQATDAARERWALQSGLRARIADLCPPGRSPKLTTKLKQWHQLADFAAFRAEIKKAFKDDIPLTERSDWENWLARDRARIAQLSATIRQTEAQINSIIYRLFNLNPTEITLLETTLAETSPS